MYKSKLKKTIPGKEKIRQMVTELESILPMTREQIVFRAIEKYYTHHTDGLRTPSIRGRIKKILLDSQHYECKYCQKPLTVRTATLDHRIPLALGGESTLDNLCATCYRCNQLKADLTDEQFYKIIGTSTPTI